MDIRWIQRFNNFKNAFKSLIYRLNDEEKGMKQMSLF